MAGYAAFVFCVDKANVQRPQSVRPLPEQSDIARYQVVGLVLNQCEASSPTEVPSDALTHRAIEGRHLELYGQ